MKKHNKKYWQNISFCLWQNKLKKLGWPDKVKFKFDVNKWGSCQYSTAYELYKLYFKIRKDLDIDKTLEVLGISFDAERSFNTDEFEENIFYKTNTIENIIKQKYKENKEKIILARRVRSFDDLFYMYRSFAKDLWYVVPKIADIAFRSYTLNNIPKSPGRGPVGNVLMQSDNFKIGILCALLKEFRYVKNEKSFSGFDT